MWPWEHAAFGYLLYSLFARLRGNRPRGTAAVLALLVATQFPDLLDKPLAWVVHVLPAGRSLGHSLLFAVPLLSAVTLVSANWRLGLGVAVVVGYLSHLAGDVLFPLITEGDLEVRFLFWPILPAESGPVDAAAHLFDLVTSFVSFLSTPRGGLYLIFEGTLLVGAFALWIADGRPGLSALRSRS